MGAAASELDLVFERQLRVLLTFALTLGLWVADVVSELGVFIPDEALHGSQRLEVYRALPRAGEVSVTGLVEKVWDTGRHAIIDVRADSDWFSAVYSVVLLRRGGFGGPPPPRAAQPAQPFFTRRKHGGHAPGAASRPLRGKRDGRGTECHLLRRAARGPATCSGPSAG